MPNLSVIGLGKLGSCLAVSLAAAGHRVYGVDLNPLVVAALKENRPNPEPGLNDLLAVPDVGKMLTFRTDLGDAAAGEVEMTFVVVPTPSKPDGSFDARAVETAVDALQTRLPRTYVVVCSTVSPGTIDRLASRCPNLSFVYSPLFIALGSVIGDIARPDFRLIGCDVPGVGGRVAEVFYSLDDPNGQSHAQRVMGLAEAEVTKLAVNAYIVQKAAFANSIAAACGEMSGVDARTVLRAVGTDHRIGHAFLAPGASPGGPCLPRDSRALEHWLSSMDAPADMPIATQAVGSHTLRQVVGWFDKYRRIAILGRSYKPGTPVSDGSFGLAVANLLTLEGKIATVHDPYDRILTVEESLECTDAVLIACPHEEYRGLDTSPLPTLDMWGIVAPGPHVTVWGRG